MPTKQSVKSWELKPLHIIIALVLIQLFITLLTNGFALSQDEAMWHYIGRNWFRNGLVPYTGGVDNKSPFFYAIFGLSDKLFGVNYWFPRVLGTACEVVGIYYIYKIALKIADKNAAILAMSFYGLSMMWHGVDGRYASFTETYDVMFTIIAFCIFLNAEGKKDFFISGVIAMIGLSFRLSAGFGILTLLGLCLYKKRAYTFTFCLGLISGVIALALLLMLAGINLHDTYTYMLADNFGAGSTTDHNFLWRTVQFYNMFFYSEVILFYPLIFIYLFINRKVDWLVLWLIFAFIGINIIGNYARVDLKDLLPPLSLMAALAVAHLVKLYNISMRQVMLIVWVCFLPKLVEPLVCFKRIFTGEFQKAENYCHEPYIIPDESASRQMGWWVKANTKSNQKVFVAGYGSQVQAYSERISPSIYFNVTQTTIAKKRLYADMKQNKPDMILVPLFPEYKQYVDADLRLYVDSLVAKDYRFETCMFNYSVYRIK
ncbi:ArnT family glycosyltransferase [Mucilaginibacter sp.]